jgi:hypothetical protein
MLLISCCILFLVWGKYLCSLYAIKVTKLWHSLSRVEEIVAAYDVSIVNAFSSISHSSVPFKFFFFFFFLLFLWDSHRQRINQLICTCSTKVFLLLPCVHFKKSGKFQKSNNSSFWIILYFRLTYSYMLLSKIQR